MFQNTPVNAFALPRKGPAPAVNVHGQLLRRFYAVGFALSSHSFKNLMENIDFASRLGRAVHGNAFWPD